MSFLFARSCFMLLSDSARFSKHFMSFQLPKKIIKKRALSWVTSAFVLIVCVTVSVTSLIGCGGSTGNNGNLPDSSISQGQSQAASSKIESSRQYPVSRGKELSEKINTASLKTKKGPKETSFLLAQKRVPVSLRVMGSDTMVHLVTAWVEAYQVVSPKTVIAVSGGGSGNGIAALLNGTNDIAPTSRAMKPEEKRLAQKNGHAYTEIPIARDAIAIIVNPKNPIQSLTLKQLELIYTGKISNWHELQSTLPNKKIILFSRESSSGTYEYFQEFVLKKNDFALSARLIPSSSSIVDTVAQDVWGIGYVGLGFVQDAGPRIKTLSVKRVTGAKAIFPSVTSVLNGQYPVSRALYLYVTQLAQSKAMPFITFCKSQKGQSIVEKAGFVPL